MRHPLYVYDDYSAMQKIVDDLSNGNYRGGGEIVSHLIVRQYKTSDAEDIVNIISRDPYNLQKGTTTNEFERYLDEPGERTRENTFVAIVDDQIIGYVSLCFVDTSIYRTTVYSYSTVDVDWRRRGIGSKLFEFIINHLIKCADKDNQIINFVHRVDSRIPGMLQLALQHNLVKGHESLILRNSTLEQINVFPLIKGYTFSSPTYVDASAWASIYNDAFNGNKSWESVVHEFKSSEFKPDLYILASNSDGEPVGLISSILTDDIGRLPTIAVKRDFQGKGLGKALLTEVLVRLNKAGAKEVTLSVGTSNDKAIRLYSKVGFIPYASRCNYWREISSTVP